MRLMQRVEPSAPASLEGYMQMGKKVAKFLLKGETTTGSSEGIEASGKPLAFVPQGVTDVNPGGRGVYSFGRCNLRNEDVSRGLRLSLHRMR